MTIALTLAMYILSNSAFAFNPRKPTDINPEEYKVILESAKKGNIIAQEKMILITYAKEEFKETYKWSKLAVAQGSIVAEITLARLYQYGQGVEKDYVESFKWHMKAAVKGEHREQFYVGNMYLVGCGVKQDLEQALKWLSKSAQKGNKQAIQELILLHTAYYQDGKMKESFDFIMVAANAGDAKAQYLVGAAYYFGKGVIRNSSMAFRWYMKAAKQGLADAQYIVGTMYLYENSTAIPKNIDKAIEWLEKAANQKHKEAAKELLKIKQSSANSKTN